MFALKGLSREQPVMGVAPELCGLEMSLLPVLAVLSEAGLPDAQTPYGHPGDGSRGRGLCCSAILRPISPDPPTPSGAQLPAFIGCWPDSGSVIFGAGRFLAFGLPVVRRAARRVGAGLAGVLVDWLVVITPGGHTDLHPGERRLARTDCSAIEDAFHVSLYATGLNTHRLFFLSMLRQAGRPSAQGAR